MSSKNKPGDVNVDGRVSDGFRYILRLRDGSVESLCDYDGYEAVVARWLEARQSNGVLRFSGAHEAPGSPLSGQGVRLAQDISGISNYSPEVLGIPKDVGQRIAALADGLEQLAEALGEGQADFSDLVDELRDRGAIDREKWAPDEDAEDEGAPPAPRPTITVLGPATGSSVAEPVDEDDE